MHPVQRKKALPAHPTLPDPIAALRPVRVHLPASTTEEVEQITLFNLKREYVDQYPILTAMWHTPNGGHRIERVSSTGQRYSPEAQKLARMGVISGVPDVQVAVPRHGFGALYIEMKKPKCISAKTGKMSDAGTLTPQQKALIPVLEQAGNLVYVEYWGVVAWNRVVWYLGLPQHLRREIVI